MNREIASPTSGRLVETIRVFNSKREAVFAAWSHPTLLAQWRGPKRFANTFHEFDFLAGGRWKLIMHGPDGGNYPNESVFVEIREPELIVLHHVSKPEFQLTAIFEEVDKNKTRLIFQQLFPTEEEYNKLKQLATKANEENMDRLEKF